MQIPKPTGQYSVGSCTFTFTDTKRKESIGPKAGIEDKKITAKIFYPTDSDELKDAKRSYIISETVSRALEKEYHIKINYTKLCQSGENDSWYYENTSPISNMNFPLVIYNHGYKSYMEGNSFLCTEIASHGYVVVSVGHAYEAVTLVHNDGEECRFYPPLMKKAAEPFLPGLLASIRLQKMKGTPEKCYEAFDKFQNKFCNFMIGRVDEWAKDTLAIVEKLKENYSDMIDFSAGIAATGHSLGGAVAYYLCQKSPDFVCGLNMDGALYGHYEDSTMTKPFFQICSENNRSVETKALLNKSAPAYYVVVKKIKHIAFADIKFFIPLGFITGKIPAQTAHDGISKIHLCFLDKYIKKKGGEIEFDSDNFFEFSKYI